MRTFSGVPGDGRCECSDGGCPEHYGKLSHAVLATMLLFRVDMQDETGTAMCDGCADEAMQSGLFTDTNDNDVIL